MSQNDPDTKLTVVEAEKVNGNKGQRGAEQHDLRLLAAPTLSALVMTVIEVS